MKQTPRPSDPNMPRNLSGVQFRYFPPQGRDQMHTLTAFNKENDPKALGTLNWHAKTGRIDWVRTHEKYRGLGVATTLFEKANKLSADTGIKAPQHSQHRTDEGDVWAKSVGGKMPRRAD